MCLPVPGLTRTRAQNIQMQVAQAMGEVRRACRGACGAGPVLCCVACGVRYRRQSLGCPGGAPPPPAAPLRAEATPPVHEALRAVVREVQLVGGELPAEMRDRVQ